MAQLALAAVILAWSSLSVVSTAPRDSCDAGAGGCAADHVSALQVGRQSKVASKPVGAAAAPPVEEEPEWRDAIEHEREVFSKLGLLEALQKHAAGPHWSAPNVEEAPETLDPESGWTSLYYPGVLSNHYNWSKQAEVSPNPVTHKTPWDPPSLPLRAPEEVRSKDGLLEYTLTVGAKWIEVPETGVRVRARVYNNQFPGPTIRVKRGDRLKITVVNKLGCDTPNDAVFPRREGQGTDAMPTGLPKDSPQYQDYGQSPHNPHEMHGVFNNFHLPNTTNLHTHGWHISSHKPQDEVVETTIHPGQNYTYDYYLSPYHASGNSWYHPHYHGSVTNQVNQGMVGALIVDDDEGEAPAWITNAREEIAVIHEAFWSYFGPDSLKVFPNDPYTGCFPFGSKSTLGCAVGHRAGLIANLSGDLLWKMQYKKGFGFADGETVPLTAFYSVNGLVRPFIEMRTGEWVRLRVIFAGGNAAINLIFNSSKCEMQLIAKDSAWLPEYPRKLTKGMWLGAGNRGQVMIRCSAPGTYKIHSLLTANGAYIQGLYDIMFVKVSGKKKWILPPKKVAVPRPRYLQSLLEVDEADLATPEVPFDGYAQNQYNGLRVAFNGSTENRVIEGKTLKSFMSFGFVSPPGVIAPAFPKAPTAYSRQPMRFMMNNMSFQYKTPAASFPAGKIIQVDLYGLDLHSWHMHVNPVQFVEWLGTDDAAVQKSYGNYFMLGDWQDVVQFPGLFACGDGTCNIGVRTRFQTDCYTGVAVVHCHFLYHEDLGMMNWYNITGPNFQTSPLFKNAGIFAKAPAQCAKDGQRCAPPQCAPEYVYGSPGKDG